MFKNYFFLLSVLLLTSCVSAPNFQENQSLAPDEGLVLTRCKAPHTFSKFLTFFEPGFKHAFINTTRPVSVECSQDNTLALVKIKAGNYFTNPSMKPMNEYQHPYFPNFTVQAGKINYIGDLYYAVKGRHQKSADVQIVNIDLSATDDFDSIMHRFKSEMPEMFRKYEVVKSIAAPLK